MAKIVTMGEIMLRLSTPGNEKFIQADEFDVCYGGGEANVAVSLANYGHSAVLKVTANASDTELSGAVNGIDGIENIAFEKVENGTTAIISIDGKTEIRPAVAKAILEKGFDLYELYLQKNSLEDVFHTLTADNGAEK